MLAKYTPAANLAVRDLAISLHFYAETLGFVLVSEHPTLLHLRCGSATILVYLSPQAGTNAATALTWSVGPELPKILAALKARGVTPLSTTPIFPASPSRAISTPAPASTANPSR